MSLESKVSYFLKSSVAAGALVGLVAISWKSFEEVEKIRVPVVACQAAENSKYLQGFLDSGSLVDLRPSNIPPYVTRVILNKCAGDAGLTPEEYLDRYTQGSRVTVLGVIASIAGFLVFVNKTLEDPKPRRPESYAVNLYGRRIRSGR